MYCICLQVLVVEHWVALSLNSSLLKLWVLKLKPDCGTSGVVPVMDYSKGIWGFKHYNECEKIPQRALRCYKEGPPKNTIISTRGISTGWLHPSVRST